MLILHGTLRRDEVKEFTKKDGSTVEKRIIHVEPSGSIYPIKISIEDHGLKLGNIGSEVSINVKVYPYYFHEGKMMRAKVNYFTPKE